MLVKDILNNPMVLAIILKGVVKEYRDLSVDDIYKKYLSTVHRKLSYGFPLPLNEKECWFYDIDVPVDGTMKDMSDINFFLYTEDRRYLTKLDPLFYFNGPDTIKRGYRIAIVISTDNNESTIEDFTLKMEGEYGKGEDLPNGFECSHYIIIRLNNRPAKEAQDYLMLLYELLKENAPLEEKERILMEAFWG